MSVPREPVTVPEDQPFEAPAGSEELLFPLKAVEITGMTVFEKETFEPLYKEKIGQEVPLSFLWDLASTISARYTDEGYFLSKAFVPAQRIDTGEVTIDVVEGYIAQVEFKGSVAEDRIIKSLKNNLLEQKPTRIQDLENSLLLLGDLYGFEIEAVLSKLDDSQDGTILLSLRQVEGDAAKLVVSANNYGSSFTGPYRAGATLEASFLPYHKTLFSVLVDLPGGNEVVSGSFFHRYQLSPKLELDFSVSNTQSNPGSELTQSDIDGDSVFFGFGARLKAVRQRDRNLDLSARFDYLDSDTDSFGSNLTRDQIRALRFGLDYEFTDQFSGLKNIELIFSRGLSGLGASDDGDPNLSRAEATSDFSKLEFFIRSQNYLFNELVLNIDLLGQWASEPLFSSEEFGFGGINIGKAYDFSEITGDNALAFSAELQFGGWQDREDLQVIPYIFYDIGSVWNKDNNGYERSTASSAGLGTRLQSGNLSFNAILAFPVSRRIDNPIHGSRDGPVFRVGFDYLFENASGS